MYSSVHKNLTVWLITIEEKYVARKYVEYLFSLYKDKLPLNHNSLVLTVVNAWYIPQVVHSHIAVMLKYSKAKFFTWQVFLFRVEKSTVNSSVAALNRNFLRFCPVSYTSCMFHKASSGSTYLVSADIMSIASAVRLFLSMHFFPFMKFKSFTAANINNWIASHTLH